MAAKSIQSDDLILVNRGGVDYRAKVSDLPIEAPESETPDLEAVIAEGGVFKTGAINAEGPAAGMAMSDTAFFIRDTLTLTPESGDGHDPGSVRGIQCLVADSNEFMGYRQTIKLLTNGNGYFEGSVESGEFIGDGSKLTGVMPLDLRTLPALP